MRALAAWKSSSPIDDARAARDRGEMHDRVGRARERAEHDHRVLEGRAREDLRRARPVPREFDGAAARRHGVSEALAGAGRRGRAARQHQPERLGEARHRRGRSHHHAGAAGGAERVLHLLDRGGVEFARPVARPHAAAVGARAEPLAAPAPGAHRPRHHAQRREIGGDRRHQMAGDGLVAAARENHRVHRLGADHLLRLHREQVAVEHRGGREQDLGERRRRERQRKPAGLEHAALHRGDDGRHVAMAGGVVARGVGDADDRAV